MGFFGAEDDGDDAADIDDEESGHGADVKEDGAPGLHALPVHQEDGGEEHREDLHVFGAGALPRDDDIDVGRDDVVADGVRAGDDGAGDARPDRAERVPVGVHEVGRDDDERGEERDENVGWGFELGELKRTGFC